MVKNRIHSLLIQQGYYLGNSDIFHKDVREAVFNLELPETIAFQYIYQMLKKDEYYRWMDEKNHARKMSEYRSFLKMKESEAGMKKSA